MVFLLIATLLFCTRYIVGAIAGINSTVWNNSEFSLHMKLTGGQLLLSLSVIAALIGFAYLIHHEYQAFKAKKSDDLL